MDAEVVYPDDPQPALPAIREQGMIASAPGAEALTWGQTLATPLAAMIRKQGLAVRIQGKEHVTVEGWTTLAAMAGMTPSEVSNTRLDDGSYLAVVALIDNQTGREMGRSSAECGMDEDRWARLPAYARRSMAATRATSKVCRQKLSWIMKLAGYEATPAEEMPGEREARHSVPATGWDGQERVPFGKHKGKPWADLEDGYLNWILDKSDNPEFRECAEREFERRENEAAAERAGNSKPGAFDGQPGMQGADRASDGSFDPDAYNV